MTDNEIIKALECCRSEDADMCRICPFHSDTYSGCWYELHKDALDLINRQKEQIKFAEKINHLQMEELQSERDKNIALVNELAKSLQDSENKQAEIWRLKGWERLLKAESHAPIIKKAKAEAVKEFAERLKEEYTN